jgi:hypothetical protein
MHTSEVDRRLPLCQCFASCPGGRQIGAAGGQEDSRKEPNTHSITCGAQGGGRAVQTACLTAAGGAAHAGAHDRVWACTTEAGQRHGRASACSRIHGPPRHCRLVHALLNRVEEEQVDTCCRLMAISRARAPCGGCSGPLPAPFGAPTVRILRRWGRQWETTGYCTPFRRSVMMEQRPCRPAATIAEKEGTSAGAPDTCFVVPAGQQGAAALQSRSACSLRSN